MAKSRQEKIASFDERIAQLENQRKLERQKMKADERKSRDRRLYKRAGLLESLLPETIPLTDEQFNTFLYRTVANNFGRDKLAQIVSEGEKTAEAPKPANTEPTTKQPQAVTDNGADGNTAKPQSTKNDTTGENGANPQNGARSGA